MSENSIEFSLSNSEQRDSWLNSGHRTLDADKFGSLTSSISVTDLRPQSKVQTKELFRIRRELDRVLASFSYTIYTYLSICPCYYYKCPLFTGSILVHVIFLSHS